ncbi:MAG: hypothetical protein JW738_09570 [Actinobacteria bacterium]|nr:hypothetical protein [Actinomycetota bacterium]
MKIKEKRSPGSRILVSVTVAIIAVVAFASCATASDAGKNDKKSTEYSFSSSSILTGASVAERQLLGLCTRNVDTRLKSIMPSSQWPNARNLRLNIPWGAIEKSKGNYDWGYSDKYINSALGLGLDSLFIVLGQPIPSWAANPNTPTKPTYGPPKDNNDFFKFCKAFAARYKDYVDFYQIYQEPGWDLDAPPAKDGVIYFYGHCEWDYVGMLRAGYNGIKAGNPNAYVISGAMLNGISRSANDFANYENLLAGANQDISMKVESNRNIVAERPMYFNYHGAWPGGTVELGVKEPKTTWYLAEGATHPGFEEWICIQNPGNSDTNVTITYMFPGGATQPQQQVLTVKAHSRSTVDVNGTVGLHKDVSAKIDSTQPVVVERPMYFNYHNAWSGGSIESGVSDLSDTWYLAEGATHTGFEEWISLMNPGAANTNVKIIYMFPGGATQEQNISMAPTSRETILVNNVVGSGKDVSAKVEASNPIIAERPMYFLYHNAWPGGHSQVGATAPGKSWFLAEGTTRSNDVDGAFEEWISIQNPGDVKAKVDITYMFNGGGTKAGSVMVPAHSRETVFVNEKVGANMDVSVQLDSDQPVVVERPMYFNYHNAYAGGDVELGCSSSGKTWYFAEGTTRSGFAEWLTLQNPNGEDATATITFMFGDGTTQQKTVGLPANSRTTVGVNQSVSIATICDGIALHPYDYPEHWSWYYNYVKNICAKNGYPNQEVVISEIGWPHSGRAEFSPEGQRLAIGDQGVGGLWGAGCRKVWIYEDVDDEPGTSWDQADNGLFYYSGSATPAWNEYLRWQSILVDYGNKPEHL